jgi:hypothetical protein
MKKCNNDSALETTKRLFSTTKASCAHSIQGKSSYIDDDKDDDVELLPDPYQEIDRKAASVTAQRVGRSNRTSKPSLTDIGQDASISIDDENSDDDITLLQDPFKKGNIKTVPSKRLSKQIQLSLDSLGVMYGAKNKRLKNKSSGNGEVQLCMPSRNDNTDSWLTSEIVRILLANPDINKQNNEEMCRMAAESAVAMHPDLSDALDLAEPAYAVYLELMSP